MSALAELDVFHSRPIAPTRRVSLGLRRLPCDPAPGWGGVLLGGIAAAHGETVPPDLREGLMLLIEQLREGRRIIQPRLRHRFQTDRVGLLRSRFRLVAESESVRFGFEDTMGTGLQYLLGAVYAAGGLPADARSAALDAIRLGLTWTGGLNGRLVSHLGGAGTARFDDPVGWALATLELDLELHFEPYQSGPTRRLVQRQYRRLLRAAHPDHGAADEGAAERIADLREARRILAARIQTAPR